MNGTEHRPSQIPIDVEQLARAIRFALVSIILGLSYFSLRSSLAIDGFERIFHDMLGGRPLPAITIFVLRAHDALLSISILVPSMTIATLFYQHVIRSFYILGGLGIITILEFIAIYHGLAAPLGQIINAMGGNP